MAKKIFTSGWADYELLDAGGGKKLERWGKIITIRPELQAYFKSGMPFTEWNTLAHWEFIEGKNQKGKWKSLRKAPEKWTIKYQSIVVELQLSPFKHLGLFPEQRVNWDFVLENCSEKDRFLNLFAYTGAMSCIARSKGAETFHVDSSKAILNRAATNMECSKLLNIKWVHEDALKYAKRLAKRGEQFDFIVMDPPAWGIGVNNEKWKLEDKLDELIAVAKSILSPEGKLILNTYSPKVNSKLLLELNDLYFPNGNTDVFELWMKSTSGKELYFGNTLRSL